MLDKNIEKKRYAKIYFANLEPIYISKDDYEYFIDSASEFATMGNLAKGCKVSVNVKNVIYIEIL